MAPHGFDFAAAADPPWAHRGHGILRIRDVGGFGEATAVSAGAVYVRRLLHVGPGPPGKTLAPVSRGESVIVEFQKDIDVVLGKGLNGGFQVRSPGWIDGPRFLRHGALPEAAQAHAGLHATGRAISRRRRLVEHLLSPLGHLQGIGLDHLFGRKIGGSLDDVVPTHEHHFLVPQLEDSLTWTAHGNVDALWMVRTLQQRRSAPGRHALRARPVGSRLSPQKLERSEG
mmetsp:Transcript_77461/g.121980  ORF Transcript_77461/g.121980 Transcript_77461/m.121980 type:complete len:228 (-) Transcript_77461:20-703(-)